MSGTAKVLQFIRSTVSGVPLAEVQGDRGGGANKTYQHFAPAGDDSAPLPDDHMATAESAGAGVEQVVGYHDTRNAGQAAPGEVRRYSRNPDDGEVVAELWLKNDGSHEMRSLNGQPIRIVTDGPVIIDSPDVRLTDAAGQGIARIGDLVSVQVPQLLSAAPGSPCVPASPIGVPNPALVVPSSGGTIAAGQIISGSSKAKSG